MSDMAKARVIKFCTWVLGTLYYILA